MRTTTIAPNKGSDRAMNLDDPHDYRKTTQLLAPLTHPPVPPGTYDIYPAHPLPAGSIEHGYDRLAKRIARESVVVIDGFAGVLWDALRRRLDAELERLGVTAHWICVDAWLRSADEIADLVRPFLGGDDPLWGTRYTGRMEDFFHPVDALPASDGMSILYGTGASLAGWKGHLVYVDLPKNELQFRARAGCPTNLGSRDLLPPKVAYKRSYFVDWPALNGLKRRLINRIDTIVDGQRADTPVFMSGEVLRKGLEEMSRGLFRVRPWFEPGPWGGDWMKSHIPALPQEAPNYAWSFEMISPENGLLFSADDIMLEVSFDMLMFEHAQEVLGNAHARFGVEFPIRFDYLDTFNGGNLSVQCHPRPDYIREHFGENFTQDETYYMLDCAPGARVYLGFNEDADTDQFRHVLEESARTGEAIDIDRYVNSELASRGDLFLIPNGTIHCSGIGNLVLEISATPYIFTFKMYDWVRRDLDGNLRPLNIARAWANLYFERRGERVRNELVSRPAVIDEGRDWRMVHLPTHPEQFYDVVRYEFETEFRATTEGDCHVMNLVEGERVMVETESGTRMAINFAESFVVPAAAESYRIVNLGKTPAKVVRAWVARHLSVFSAPQ